MLLLPNEIQRQIYEYDNTYNEIYNEVIKELIPVKYRIIKMHYSSFTILEKYENYYKLQLPNNKISKILVLSRIEAQTKIENNIKLMIQETDEYINDYLKYVFSKKCIKIINNLLNIGDTPFLNKHNRAKFLYPYTKEYEYYDIYTKEYYYIFST